MSADSLPDDSPTASRTWGRPTVALLAVVAFVSATFALQASYVVTMPLAFAFFVAVSVYPIQRAVARRVPRKLRWLGVAAAISVVLLVAALFVGVLVAAGAYIADKAPDYQDDAVRVRDQVISWAESKGIPLDKTAALGGVGDPARFEIPGWLRAYLTAGLTSFWSLAGLLVLVFFFVLLMLMEARRWAEKADAAMAGSNARATIDAVTAISQKVRGYLVNQTSVSLISGVVEGTFLWLMGVELAFAWGVLFFVMNYIPNLGSLVAAVPPVLIAAATLGLGKALAVAVGLFVIEQIIGNGIAPRLQGNKLAISPLVILVSVIFWGWVWGVIGAVLAVPLTAAILIACAHVESMKPLAMLLSTTADDRELKKQTHAEG